MRLRDRYAKHNHVYKKIFWRFNYPLCMGLYFFAPTKVMGLYIALCSIYANVETSYGAEEAQKAQG